MKEYLIELFYHPELNRLSLQPFFAINLYNSIRQNVYQLKAPL